MGSQPAAEIAAQHGGFLANLLAFYLQILCSHPLKQVMSQIGVLYEPVDVSPNQPLDPLLGLLGFRQDTPYRPMDALQAFQIQRRGEPLFALEVIVDAAHARTRPLLNIGHAGFAEALNRKAIERRGHNFLSPPLAALYQFASWHLAVRLSWKSYIRCARIINHSTP